MKKAKKECPLECRCTKCGKEHNFELPEQKGVPKLCYNCANGEMAKIEVELYKSFTEKQKELFERADAIREYIQVYAILSS